MEGQNLSGQLSDWSINDLLQIMQVTKKTGSLDIEGERRGRVHFVDGAVTGAELSGEKGIYEGTDRASIADILYVLSTLDSGSFGVGPADGPDGDGFAVEDIMGEVSALRSLEGEVIDAGLFEAAGVKLVSEIDESITMDPQDWQMLVSLVQPFTFDFLESRVGRGGAVRIFHTLHRLGVAEAISGDGESEWLDQLAGGLSRKTSDAMWLEESPRETTEEDRSTAKHVAPDEDIPVVAASDDSMPATESEEVSSGSDDSSEDANDTSDEEAEEKVAVGSERIVAETVRVEARGVSAHASTTLTDGVYDEIRRLRSKASDSK